MASSFENIGKKLSEIASTTAKKANDQVQIAKLNVDVAGVEKEIDGVYLAIGRYCYQKTARGTAIDPDISEYCADIDGLKKRIESLQEQIAAIKADGYTPPEEKKEGYTFTSAVPPRESAQQPEKQDQEPKE